VRSEQDGRNQLCKAVAAIKRGEGGGGGGEGWLSYCKALQDQWPSLEIPNQQVSDIREQKADSKQWTSDSKQFRLILVQDRRQRRRARQANRSEELCMASHVILGELKLMTVAKQTCFLTIIYEKSSATGEEE
jgi:hypothetical protein